MTRPIVGIDPGRDGGAVVLAPDGRHVVAAYRWRHSVRGWFNLRTIAANQPGPTVRVGSLGDVGAAIERRIAGRDVVLCVEGLFVPRPDKGKKPGAKYLGQVARVVTLGEYAGQVFGPAARHASVTFRPSAGQWRPLVLGIPASSPSKFAEEHAITALTRARPPLVVGLGELAKDPHVAEAACIARFGWLKAKEAAAVYP
ncbi:MAG: hypothetical protein KAQ88_11050 [Hyphomicrobiaceae bacterium]|nr:hypothetical protein [Hyphomicrobiaceae bacterium]